MKKLSNIEEFKNFRQRILKEKAMEMEDVKPCLVICAGTGGQASGSNDIMRIIKRYILENDLQEKISIRITGCQGFCEMDPFILVEPGQHLYPKLKMENVPEVINAALEGKVIEKLLYKDSLEHKHYQHQSEIPFFEKQTRTILGNNQKLDPIRILDYVEVGGYAAFEKVMSKPDPGWIIEEIKRSGLRGRGGGGFPTGKKWELARKAVSKSNQKFIVCNADEGDPGAYMDRSLLEGNPHAIIEGMLIAGIAIGAAKGFIYVRTEYPLAIKHALIAIRQARDFGILGNDILGTGIDFDIEIIRGAGAFVCGEETALIRSIEDRIGEPRQKPPYPIESGIFGRSTVINNVETLANVPVIISKGAEEYAKVGVPGNTGTKIFSLVGKIRNTGLVEVPLGMKLGEVIYDIGGGPAGKAKIKAVQTGGPSGGCIPAEMFDIHVDYDSLANAGSIMGSGGLIVMDENTCMVDIARYYMNFLKDESCGKCFTCRKGTQRMFEILDDVTKGKATIKDLDLLEELANTVKDTTLCGLGQTASNPVLSTLRYFRHEFEEHILQKKCRALVCKEIVGAPCQSACPLGTEAWRYIAYISRGENDEAYKVIRQANPFPSVCARVCSHPCEDRCRTGTTGIEPIAVRSLKRFITDHTDPSIYKPVRAGENTHRVAIIGSGPAGLTAAHYLSLNGYKPTVFEADSKSGGMLVSCIPAYRLPREILDKEINSIIDKNVTLKLNTAMGRDITLNGLFEEGYKAVFLAMGAHKSQKLNIEGEDIAGIYPSILFLKTFNLQGKNLAKGHVGIIGGGNSAVDAARVAIRQENVQSVTIFYRRTRREMPAYEEEIQAALQEGIKLKPLAAPVKIRSGGGCLKGVEFINNKLGELDSSGRRKPIPISGSEHFVPLDTLIVAISEKPDIDLISSMGIEISKGGTLAVDPETLETNKPGVFAGGDVVTGPNTVVEAIAVGKKAALMIDRYIQGKALRQPPVVRLPEVYVEPITLNEEELNKSLRAKPPVIDIEERKCNFKEVEKSLSDEDAIEEAKRCLRCDLEFTQLKKDETECLMSGGNKA